MKRILFICAIMMVACLGMNAQETEKALSGSKFLKKLKGSYVELFSQETCLNAKYDSLWKSEALKYVDSSKADSVITLIQRQCQGDKTGAEAIAYNKLHGSMQFCCSFLQGVKRFEIKDRCISGFAADGSLLFSHTYHFVEHDDNGNYIFEADDSNQDEFRYFWFMPDSPKTTYHIEFRYGSDKAQLSQMMEGKCAFWMAAGVREGHEDEWVNGITLFVEERLRGE